LLIKNNKLIISDNKINKTWLRVIDEWVNDDTMTLLVRKGGEIRGTKVVLVSERNIITTDNTPAHWVFKKLVLDRKSSY
jgi:hypothetical protein